MYGKAPIALGQIHLSPSEFCFVQDMPIIMPGKGMRIPDNLLWVEPLLEHVAFDENDYVYLTAKHFYVSRTHLGNRPGWHTDGFGTNDTTYLWWNIHSPDFLLMDGLNISKDEHTSMSDMTHQAKKDCIVNYPDRMLLKLDPFVIHRVNQQITACNRAFVKVTVSRDQFNLIGNAHNHLFDYKWQMVPRYMERNLTSKPVPVDIRFDEELQCHIAAMSDNTVLYSKDQMNWFKEPKG